MKISPGFNGLLQIRNKRMKRLNWVWIETFRKRWRRPVSLSKGVFGSTVRNLHRKPVRSWPTRLQILMPNLLSSSLRCWRERCRSKEKTGKRRWPWSSSESQQTQDESRVWVENDPDGGSEEVPFVFLWFSVSQWTSGKTPGCSLRNGDGGSRRGHKHYFNV